EDLRVLHAGCRSDVRLIKKLRPLVGRAFLGSRRGYGGGARRYVSHLGQHALDEVVLEPRGATGSRTGNGSVGSCLRAARVHGRAERETLVIRKLGRGGSHAGGRGRVAGRIGAERHGGFCANARVRRLPQRRSLATYA